jgi:SAM-dependent methyltransferase
VTDQNQPAQRTQEWDVIDERALAYHMVQWSEPKRSTLAFHEYAEAKLRSAGRIVDLGCGAGAATAYLASRHPDQEFVGVDISPELIAIAARLARDKSSGNLSFRADDWYGLGEYPPVDVVVSMQSLSWLPGFEQPLAAIFERLRPQSIIASSLFYDGRISCRIEVEEHLRDRKTFYNVYSIQAVDDFCALHGYRVTTHAPFHIDIDIPKPVDQDFMSTYTVPVQGRSGPERLQISGPLLLNWRFVTIERR